MRKITVTSLLVLALLLMPLGSTQAVPTVLFEGRPLSFDVPPFIEQGRTLVPLRGISEALGAEVAWDDDTRTVLVVYQTTTIKLQIANPQALKNSQRISLDVAPRIVQGRTMVPLRFVSEAFGASVAWNPNTRSVSIDMPTSDENPSENLEREIFELANSARIERGLKPFKWDERLADVARQHSRDMRDRGFFSHENPDGETPFDRLEKAGISCRAAAENIAAGYRDAASAHEGWMNSPGHRENILGEYDYLGVGVSLGGEHEVYFTQNFYTPR